MIHVRIASEYKHIPFEIEIEGQNPNAFDIEHLGKLLEQIRRFIDGMLEAKKQ